MERLQKLAKRKHSPQTVGDAAYWACHTYWSEFKEAIKTKQSEFACNSAWVSYEGCVWYHQGPKHGPSFPPTYDACHSGW